MSHQIFFALSMQLVLINSLMKFSYSPPAGKIIRNIGAGKLVEKLCTGRISSPCPFPARRESLVEKRQDVRHKVAGVIHQLDRGLAVFHADMHVQPKNQICPRYKLQVFNDILVADVLGNFLPPASPQRMGGSRRQPQAVSLWPKRSCPRLSFLTSSLASFDIAADGGSDLDHRTGASQP